MLEGKDYFTGCWCVVVSERTQCLVASHVFKLRAMDNYYLWLAVFNFQCSSPSFGRLAFLFSRAEVKQRIGTLTSVQECWHCWLGDHKLKAGPVCTLIHGGSSWTFPVPNTDPESAVSSRTPVCFFIEASWRPLSGGLRHSFQLCIISKHLEDGVKKHFIDR